MICRSNMLHLTTGGISDGKEKNRAIAANSMRSLTASSATAFTDCIRADKRSNNR